MNNVPWLAIIFFSLVWAICLFSVLRPDKVVNVTAKYFKWSMQMYGFEGEIKPTFKARIICRFWNIFGLVVFSYFLFLTFSGKLR